MSNPVFIDTPAQLAEHAARWSQAPWLALDTEFVRVDTYYPKLCLIQVSDTVSHACVDTLALQDPSLLLQTINNGRILSVLHAASQDLEILVQLSGQVPAPLFDTQVAATLLGLGDQIGYAGLVEKRLGLPVDKSLARTDWSRRPLKENEIAYAADDVRHLADMYPALRAELEARGRLTWLEEDCARMHDPAQYQTLPENAWQRLKGMQRLKPQEQVVAARLAAWREAEAQRRNRPRKWIIDDDALYAMATRQPQTAEQLEALKLVPPKTLERRGKDLLEVIAAARAEPPVALAQVEEFTQAQTAMLRKLQEELLNRAKELQLPAPYLASRSDLGKLVRDGGGADINLLKGWRREVAGEVLLKLL
jgi:ribonuclease D